MNLKKKSRKLLPFAEQMGLQDAGSLGFWDDWRDMVMRGDRGETSSPNRGVVPGMWGRLGWGSDRRGGDGHTTTSIVTVAGRNPGVWGVGCCLYSAAVYHHTLRLRLSTTSRQTTPTNYYVRNSLSLSYNKTH